jgi:hypothetical protein
VEAAGIEPERPTNTNLVMALDCALHVHGLDGRRFSTTVRSSLPESTHVAETYWRRFERCNARPLKSGRRDGTPVTELDTGIPTILSENHKLLHDAVIANAHSGEIEAGCNLRPVLITMVPCIRELATVCAICHRSNLLAINVVYLDADSRAS